MKGDIENRWEGGEDGFGPRVKRETNIEMDTESSAATEHPTPTAERSIQSRIWQK